MSARNGYRVLATVAVVVVASLPAAGQDAARQPADNERLQEIWLVVPDAGSARDSLIVEVARELARTPQRHRLRFVDGGDLRELADAGDSQLLALFEVARDRSLTVAHLELARAEGVTTPGWLLHTVLQAGEVVGVEVRIAGSRFSWIEQLVERSTRRRQPSVADDALARGHASALLYLPVRAGGERGAEAEHGARGISPAGRLLAALSRRLDGFDAAPLFEDEFLVVAGRVWLRRDLYWSVLLLWLLLYWRGRRQPGREFRWAFLIAALVTPVFALVLVGLPAAVAAWRPKWRSAYGLALSPIVLFGVRWAMAVAGDRRPVVDLVPVLVVIAALVLFAWSYLARGEAGPTTASSG